MLRRPLQSLRFRALAVVLGAALCVGAAVETQDPVARPQLLSSSESAVAAQRESTAVFREFSTSRPIELARFHPAPARVSHRPTAPSLVGSALSFEAPAIGSGPFGAQPLLIACPPQGPPQLA